MELTQTIFFNMNKKFEKNIWNVENDFFHRCDNSRIAKILAYYKLFNIAKKTNGDFVICGVFKGVSTIEFSTFIKLFEKNQRRVIVFDQFKYFPKNNEDPKSNLIIKQMGKKTISSTNLKNILTKKKIFNVEIVDGKIPNSIFKFFKNNLTIKISLLIMDIDIYDRNFKSLDFIYPLIVDGGIIIFNDYGVFDYESSKINNFLKEHNLRIKNLKFSKTPYYVIKK